MDQSVFNWALGAINVLAGFILKAVWDSVKDLQKADSTLAERVGSIEVLVVGNYVKREDFSRISDAIFAKLDRIEDKLDAKVDK